MKKSVKAVAMLAACLTALAAPVGQAFAQEAEMFVQMRTVKMMDANKDGKVSKAEFINTNCVNAPINTCLACSYNTPTTLACRTSLWVKACSATGPSLAQCSICPVIERAFGAASVVVDCAK